MYKRVTKTRVISHGRYDDTDNDNNDDNDPEMKLMEKMIIIMISVI